MAATVDRPKGGCTAFLATIFKACLKLQKVSAFVDDLGADSLDLVELIMSLEEEFSNPSQKVEIPDEDAEKIVTVQDAIDYLKDLGVEDD